MTFAPIALFVFNRPQHTRRTVEALLKNTYSENSGLIVFADAAKTPEQEPAVNEVRAYLHTITGFKFVQIVEREKNFGLANSIINGVTTVVNQYGKVIVVEDDLVTSPYFLQYMNTALDYYEKNEAVVCIHGYVYPVKEKLPETFFLKGADCWGWATWKRGWELFEPDGQKLLTALVDKNLTREFDYDYSYAFTKMLADQIKGKNNSWAIRWQASAFINNKLTLYPGRSLVQNIGNDGSGVHSDSSTIFDVHLANTPVPVTNIPVAVNKEARNAFVQYFNSIKPGFIDKVYSKLKSMFKNAVSK